MAKNSYRQIIEDEKKILDELHKNANKSINEIAKSCGFSRQKVWRMIKNLERNNVIWGYTAVVDNSKQNLESFLVLIKRSNQPVSKDLLDNILNRKLVSASSKMEVRVVSSLYTNGVYDWVIIFNAKDVKEAKKFVESLNKVFEGYITEIQLIETMFSVQNGGIENPEKERLRDFFDVKG